MTKDVYADDDQMRTHRPVPLVTALFYVEADAAPDTLARVANVLALSNRPPAQASAIATDDDRLIISIEVRDCPVDTAEYLRRKLEQLTCTVTATVVPTITHVSVPAV